jgi:hypothetical protein
MVAHLALNALTRLVAGTSEAINGEVIAAKTKLVRVVGPVRARRLRRGVVGDAVQAYITSQESATLVKFFFS